MENLLKKEYLNENDIIGSALKSELPLSKYINDLETIQVSLMQKIQILASNYHENILKHNSSLQGLGNNIKNLIKKTIALQQRTGKLGNELESSLEKMEDGVKKLEKIEKASELVKLAHQYFAKSKKTKFTSDKELEDLAHRLNGVFVVEKAFRSKSSLA